MSTADSNTAWTKLQQIYLEDATFYAAINTMARDQGHGVGYILHCLAASGFAGVVIAMAEATAAAKNQIVRLEMTQPGLPDWMRDIITEAKQE